MDEQSRREFLAEAEELLDVLFGDIRTLRLRRGEGRARRELIGRIFRHVHTLKGLAAAIGLDATGEIAHEFESLLDAVRTGRAPVDDAVLEAFGDAADAVARSLGATVHGKSLFVPPALVERLRRLASVDVREPATPAGDSSATALAALPEEIVQVLSEHETQRLREAVSEGARLYVVAVDFDLLTFDEQFRRMGDALAEIGEVVSTLPGMATSAPDRINFRLVYAATQNRETVAARVAPFGASLTEAFAPDTATHPHRAQEDERQDDEEPHDALIAIASLTKMVRVPLDDLDDVISTTHELFNDTSALLDRALANDLARPAQAEIENSATHIRRRFAELAGQLIGLRMVRSGRMLERLARAGHDAARTMGKDVEIEIKGGEVRLDKSLADRIADPLLHMLRNAVDHGIEAADVRRGAGKPPRGRIRLEAATDGSRVILRITDDGGGIDAERIARAAVERGLVADVASVDERQALRLIFRPGFSTASEVTSMSGRGVGLEVVERAVEQVGGELRVQTRRGAGTTFEMRLPTTLALVPSLVVYSAGNCYGVDAGQVVEAGEVARSETEEVGGARVVRWRGAVVPLVTLRTLLAPGEDNDEARRADATDEARLHIIITRLASRDGDDTGDEPESARTAVIVDRCDGQRELLVRGLGRHAARWRGITGATELRDGTVALMLDLPQLLEMQP